MRADFAILIMVYGRPNKMWTLKTFREAGYTGKVYFIADESDSELDGYKKKYGDDLVVFNKLEVGRSMDSGDNTGDLRSTMYAANTSFDIAREKKLKYFMLVCDDYTNISYAFDDLLELRRRAVKNLDKVIEAMITYYEKIPVLTLAMAQGGDFSGGKFNDSNDIKLKRKAMNTFLCCVDRPFKFVGRLNEDVTTYVLLGSRGNLFLTFTNIMINQKATQSEKSGLTEVYRDSGTYVKSFFSVMYNPSSVKISEVGDKYKRVHHKVNWNNAVPVILAEKHKKEVVK